VEGFFTIPQSLHREGEHKLSEENGDSPDLEPLEMNEEDLVEEPIDEDEEPSGVIFDGKKGYVAKDDADRISQQGFYGTRLDDGRLELEPVELLHLIERKRIFVETKSAEQIEADFIVKADFIVNELIDEDPGLWVRYLVFRDLRSRGYAVRSGFGRGIGFRVYARGDRPGVATANQLIYVLKEGIPISLQDSCRSEWRSELLQSGSDSTE
ncbi:MAG: hypothetical protein ACXAEB_12375, partial [Candidatus Thorarchaeota archaeon]